MNPWHCWILIVLAALCAGCGYSTDSRLPGGARKVAVDIFSNETFYREIEFQLTRFLTEELNHRTAYRVARRGNADVLLSGRIIDVRRPTIVEGESDLVSEQAVIVSAEVQLIQLSDGRRLEQFRVSNRAEFIVERGETLETAFNEALKDLAEDIVNNLERGTFVQDLVRLSAESDISEPASQPSDSGQDSK